MRWIVFVTALSMAVLSLAPAGATAGMTGGVDVAVWPPGLAEVGEHGECRPDGTADISGQGVYSPLVRPADRTLDSTFKLSLPIFSAAYGAGLLNLCGYMTSSPVPTVSYAWPWLNPFDIEPGEPPPIHTYWHSSCFDSKGYGGRGFADFGSGVRLRVWDFGWKLAAAHKMVALGRWEDQSTWFPSSGKSGQLVASFMAQGGAACFVPGGARYFSVTGAHALLAGESASWNDITDEAEPKNDGQTWLLNPWGDKSRS